MEKERSNPPQNRRGKRWKIALGVVVALVLLIGGGEIWLNRMMIHTLAEETERLTQGAFHLQVDQVRVRLFQRGAQLRGVTLVGDSAVLARHSGRLVALRLEVEELSAMRVHLKRSTGQLFLGRLVLKNPQLFLTRRTQADSLSHSDTVASAQGVAERLLKEIVVGHFKIRNGTIHYRQEGVTQPLEHTVAGISLQTDHLHLDMTGTDKGRSLLQGEVKALLTGVNYQFKEGAFELKTDTIKLDTKKHTFAVSGLSLLPQFSKRDFALVVEEHPDWLEVQLASMQASGVDFDALFAHKGLRVDSVGVTGLILQSFKNRQIPQTPRVKALLWQTLHRIPFEVSVRKIGFSDVNVTYQELSPSGITPGIVTFNRLRGVVAGLSNRVTTHRQNYTIHASGWLMHSGPISAYFTIPILPQHDTFSVHGTLGEMPAKALNPVLRPLVNLQINSGMIHKMDFHITGDSTASRVRLDLRYDGLNIALMKDAAGKWKQRKFLSAVVDDLVLLHSNPLEGKMREGTGAFKRDPYRSQFNYLWKSLLPGIKSTVVRQDTRTESLNREARQALRAERRMERKRLHEQASKP